MSIMGMQLSRLVLVVVASHALACSADIHYVSKTGSNEFPHASPRTAARSIQDAVDAAEYGDIVDVAPGEYVQQVTLKDGIILWGWGADTTVIRQPEDIPEEAPYAIRGAEDAQIRDLSVASPPGERPGYWPSWPPGIVLGPYSGQLVSDCLVSGSFSEGIRCDGPSPGTPVIIRKTTVEGCRGRGIYMFRCLGVIDRCVVRDCWTGVCAAWGDLVLTRSTFLHSGIWLASARAEIYSSWFLGEGIDGEFLYLTAHNCVIWGADTGVHGNSGTVELINCTITGNEVGLQCFEIDTLVRNTIIWGNLSGGIQNMYAETEVAYSNVQGPFPDDDCSPPPDVWPGYGNIVADPKFRDPQNLDFHLLRDSPCIDACSPDWPPLIYFPSNSDLWIPFLDMDEKPRRLHGGTEHHWSLPTIDMGAYEFSLSMIEPAEGGGLTLTWSSVSGRTYSVYYSDDLLKWHLAQPKVLSEGDWTTSWMDAEGSGTPLPPWQAPLRFYRAVENVEGSQPW